MKIHEKKFSSHAGRQERRCRRGPERMQRRYWSHTGASRSRKGQTEPQKGQVLQGHWSQANHIWESTVIVEEWELEAFHSKKLGRKVLPGVSPSPHQFRRPAETEQSVVSRPTSPSSKFSLSQGLELKPCSKKSIFLGLLDLKLFHSTGLLLNGERKLQGKLSNQKSDPKSFPFFLSFTITTCSGITKSITKEDDRALPVGWSPECPGKEKGRHILNRYGGKSVPTHKVPAPDPPP